MRIVIHREYLYSKLPCQECFLKKIIQKSKGVIFEQLNNFVIIHSQLNNWVNTYVVTNNNIYKARFEKINIDVNGLRSGFNIVNNDVVFVRTIHGRKIVYKLVPHEVVNSCKCVKCVMNLLKS